MHKIKKEISAGGVVLDFINDAPSIVIYSRRNATQWCLPKGKIEEGETAKIAATREVLEEVGLSVDVIEHLDDIHYKYEDEKRNLSINKTVHFFLMKKKSQVSCEYDPEVEAVKWVSFDQAIKILTFESERMLVNKARQFLRKGI